MRSRKDLKGESFQFKSEACSRLIRSAPRMKCSPVRHTGEGKSSYRSLRVTIDESDLPIPGRSCFSRAGSKCRCPSFSVECQCDSAGIRSMKAFKNEPFG